MATFTPQSQHVSQRVDRPTREVYAYASDPSRWPEWAHGLAGAMEEVDGKWVADAGPIGRVTIDFAPKNGFGVLDHDVTLPSGEVVYNPFRVIDDGTGCELVFTVRRRPGMSDEEFAADAAAVAADLARLKQLVEVQH